MEMINIKKPDKSESKFWFKEEKIDGGKIQKFNHAYYENCLEDYCCKLEQYLNSLKTEKIISEVVNNFKFAKGQFIRFEYDILEKDGLYKWRQVEIDNSRKQEGNIRCSKYFNNVYECICNSWTDYYNLMLK
jgi:hypothetical protein